MTDPVRISLLLQEPDAVTSDISEPMPYEAAREILIWFIPWGARWHPGDRQFDMQYGFPVCRAEIVAA